MSNGKKRKSKAHGIMGRSDIPFAKRMAMQHQSDIVVNRDHAAKIVMYCMSVAMHELEGIGYKRLVRFSFHFKQVVDEFYEDPEVGMAHAKRYMEQIGMPVSGEFYTINVKGQSRRAQNLDNHKLQASQIALLCGAITMNKEFGFGQERQTRISDRVTELTGRYAKEGEKFLLEEMEKIGFLIVDGDVRACIDDDGNAVSLKNWREQQC